MNLYKAFKTDPKLEAVTGVNIDLGDQSILIHRAGGANQAFVDMLTARTKPLQMQIKAGTLDNKAAAKVLAEVYAATVVKGWTGVKDENDALLDFTAENVVKIFTDLPEFFATIQAEANRIGNFQAEAVKATTETLKNE